MPPTANYYHPPLCGMKVDSECRKRRFLKRNNQSSSMRNVPFFFMRNLPCFHIGAEGSDWLPATTRKLFRILYFKNEEESLSFHIPNKSNTTFGDLLIFPSIFPYVINGCPPISILLECKYVGGLCLLDDRSSAQSW